MFVCLRGEVFGSMMLDKPTERRLEDKGSRAVGYLFGGMSVLCALVSFGFFQLYGHLHWHPARTGFHIGNLMDLGEILDSLHLISQFCALGAVVLSIASVFFKTRIIGFVSLIVSAFALSASLTNY